MYYIEKVGILRLLIGLASTDMYIYGCTEKRAGIRQNNSDGCDFEMKIR